MGKIAEMISSLKSMELPKGAESLLSSISTEAATLEADRDDLKGKVETRQTENGKLKDRAQTAEARVTELEAAAPNADTLTAYAALGTPEEVKASLEQAARDRQAVVTQANRDALNTIGLKPSALRLREFDSVNVTASKEGDVLTATVKEGETETSWADWVKAKGLEVDLKDFGLEPASPVIVPALAQVGGRQQPIGKTEQQREQEVRKEVSI